MATSHERPRKIEESTADVLRRHRKPEVTESSFDGILALQRSAGNEVVNYVLSGGKPMTLDTHQRVQPALKVGAAHDPFEAEADRIADTVMKMSDSDVKAPPSAHAADGLDDPDVLPMRIRRATAVPDEAAFELTGPAETGVKSVLNGGGSPLPHSERNFFERRMGYDLGAVRVHNDPAAAHASRAINAKAFTVGGDIAFGEGAYKPGTPDGRKLLAHELAHVVQQGAAVQTKRLSPEEDR